MISPISILSRGRISDSDKRTITLASKGWIVLVIAPLSEEDEFIRRGVGGVGLKSYRRTNHDYYKDLKEEDNKKRLMRDDEEVYAIINTFMLCLD